MSITLTPKMQEQSNKSFSLLLSLAQPEQKEIFTQHQAQLQEIFGLSDFIANVFIRHPKIGVKILQEGHLTTQVDPSIYGELLKNATMNITDVNAFKRAIHDFKIEKAAIIAWRELTSKADVTEGFAHASELAEVIIIQTLDFLYDLNCKLYGTPVDENGNPQRMLVLGMGKLGGKELNFSSDIDLIFCYHRPGETTGARKVIENQVFFTRLGQQLIQALDQKTSDGLVYRVDMRLRPFGDSGPLVSSFPALEDYYLKHGRSWERYAMVKSRILGPATKEGQILYEMLRPFVFRRYLDFSAIESLRKMKGMIEAEVRRRRLQDNFKLGEGGIREVEFIAQVFQLMRGGRIIALQERNLLAVLDYLRNCSLIDDKAYVTLKNSYLFLRKTENILQELNDEQTQTLPARPLDQDRLFTALGFNNYAEFCKQLQDVMKRVHYEFSLIIKDPDEEEIITEDPEFSDLWLLPMDVNEVCELLNRIYADKSELKSLADVIVKMRAEVARKAIGPQGREILNKLMPYMFAKLAPMYGVAKLFARISGLILRICQRTTYLQLITENPQVCDHLIRLCAGSQLITEQLTEHPILLDELLMPQSLYTPLDPVYYPQELREFMLRVESNDLEQQMESLRQFKQIQLLRTCAADLVGALPLMKVSDNLTYLAQAILAEVVNLSWNQLTAKYGKPSNYYNHDDMGICVIAYGKMGGIELGYGSDLDLVFLCDSELSGQTDGATVISDAMFYGRFAQRLMHLFSTRLSAGILYEVDTRLRPEGEAGPLICSLNGYRNYLDTKAWTWELQALVRARAVFGPERLTTEFDEIRRRIIHKPREVDKLRQEVIDMRKKMRDNLIKGPKNAFDIKQSFGGMADIEFMAQFLVLANAPLHDDMVLWSDNVRIFEECARLQFIPQFIAKDLIAAYLAIRNRYHRNSLQGLSRVIDTNELDKERSFVQRVWNALMLQQTTLDEVTPITTD